MKRIFKHTIFALSAIASTIAFSSCDTDIESVNIVTPGIEQQNPELHANYLSDLRAYKASQTQHLLLVTSITAINNLAINHNVSTHYLIVLIMFA